MEHDPSNEMHRLRRERKKKSLFNDMLKEAEEKLRGELSRTYEFEKTLLQKDYESQLLLKIQSLESHVAKIKEQDALLKELTARSTMATKHVQDIAYKALETSSQRFMFPTMENKASASKSEGT
jgi:hypothetical protein